MGFQFRKSAKVGVFRFNFGKSGLSSVSVGGRGARVSVGKRGAYSTVSAPGTGISYRTKIGGTTKAKRQPSARVSPQYQPVRQQQLQQQMAAQADVVAHSIITTQTPEQMNIIYQSYLENARETIAVISSQIAAQGISSDLLPYIEPALIRYMDSWVAVRPGVV